MAVKKHKIKNKTEYTVSSSSMRGVDFSSDESEHKRYRFSHLENMYKDYDAGGAGIIESVPGFRKILSFSGKVHSIFSHRDKNGKEYVVIHAGKSLYRIPLTAIDSLAYTPTSLIDVSDKKSRGFVSGCDLYILDGKNTIRIDGNGVAAAVSDEGDAAPYIPTTYYNGEEFEQRNLLTNKFCEKYLISAASDMAAGSEGLKYRIISVEEHLAAVSGIEEGFSGEVSIPSYVALGNERYKVTEIDSKAFIYNKKITRVILSDSILHIQASAFQECTALREVITSDSLEHINNSAFLGCSTLDSFYLGAGVKHIDVGVFSLCGSLKSINYAGSSESFSKILKDFDMSNISVNYNARYTNITVEIPIFSPASELSSVTIGGDAAEYGVRAHSSLITSITISCADKSKIDGKEVVILGVANDEKFTLNSLGTNFIAEHQNSISGKNAILGCTVCESFDGRVFLSGNPKLPNTVFYSTRDSSGRNNPLYFGVLNYFNDGTGAFEVESLLAAGESLAVFKSGDDGGGSIYYHTPKETGIDILPKIYPVSYIHSGISAIGDSISFFDDRLFLSALGVCALDKQKINLERSIAIRSHNVNKRLLSEDLSSASLAKWCGYLAVCVGGNIYLADSRQLFTHSTGHVEYEWFFLSGIGTYSGEQKVFRYASCAKEGYSTHPDCDAIVTGTVFVSMTENGEYVYYSKEKGVKYEVYTDGECTGGVFSPACCIFNIGNDLLLFGTENGDVCIFNNDKRGIAPPWLSEAEGFDAEEYKKHFGKRLHPYYYSFAFHPPHYAIKTVSDNGGFPNLTKNTVKHSLAVKLRSHGHGSLTCEVGTEGDGYREISKIPDAALNFDELDFSALSFTNTEYVTLPIKEREKGWIEKSMSFYSDEYSSPFGVCSITYRFEIKGRIKN